MKVHCIVTGISFLLSSFLNVSMSETRWGIVDSRFDGESPRLMWCATVEESLRADVHRSYEVLVCYDSAALEPLYELEVSERLVRYDFPLAGKKGAQLSVWKNEIFSVEAIADPPRRFVYLFLLEAEKRYRVLLRVEVVTQTGRAGQMEQLPAEELLAQDTRDFLRAIQRKDRTALQRSTMVQIAAWLVSAKGKIGDAEERILLPSCRARIGNRIVDVPLASSEAGGLVLRLPAKSEDTFTLLPAIHRQILTPYSRRVGIEVKPLPSYAYVKLERDDGTIRLFGTKTKRAGEFELGPTKVGNMQRLRLDAAHPFYARSSPPGMTALVLFRTGRPIERFLDEGTVPPFPPLPDGCKPADIIEVVLRQAQSAIDPDRGVVMGLAGDDRIALYAAGHDLLSGYSELRDILKAAFMETVAERSWSIREEPMLSNDSGWTERDAMTALRYPSLARQLAVRLSHESEPVLELFKTKEEIEPEREIDRQSVAPHAAAAAALAKSGSAEFDSLIDVQLRHMVGMHHAMEPSLWRLSEIEDVGHSLKIVSGCSNDPKTKALAGEILRLAREEAFRRFKEEYSEMKLSEKAGIAHLMSTTWYPHYRMPGPMDSLLEKASKEVPTQRMAPGRGGRDVTGQVLEDARRIYRAALERGLKEVRASKKSKREKRAWAERFLDEWHDYLFQVHKGGYLQPYESELQRDRQRMMKLFK